MKKSQLIQIIDLLSFLALTAMITTGLLLEFSLPPRSGGSSVLTLTRHEWGNLHFYISVTFILLMIAHLLTHINYIKAAVVGKATKEQKYRIAVGVLGLVSLLLLSIVLLTTPVEEDSSVRGWQHKTKQVSPDN